MLNVVMLIKQIVTDQPTPDSTYANAQYYHVQINGNFKKLQYAYCGAQHPWSNCNDLTESVA